MLWYKAWLDTRWRFLIGLALLTCSAIAIVVTYPKVMALMPLVPASDSGGELGRRIREAAELSRDYRGYVWSQWFRQTPTQTGTLFAVLLGTGGLLSHASGGAALFTLSLPISRSRLLRVRATAGLVELFILVLVPSLAIPLVSPGVGQSYAVGNAVVHAICLFAAGAVFYSLALLLSTVFGDIWRPLLIALCMAVALGIFEQLFREVSGYGIFGLMDGEIYFRTGRIPWQGLLVTIVVSAAMLFAAEMNLARRDF